MKNKKSLQPAKKLPVKDHFTELIKRFYVWMFFFVLGSIFGYLKHQIILEWLIVPLNKPLYYMSPIGGFETVFTVSLLSGFILSLPILIYQIIVFVLPLESKTTFFKILIYLLSSLFLAVSGILISYYLVFPASLTFLGKFGSGQLESLISTKDYFTFVTKYLLGFAILFQLPLVIYTISLVTPITPKILLKKLNYVIVASFIFSAILTPTPDFFNQAIMAAPIIFLYVLTILILFFKQTIVK